MAKKKVVMEYDSEEWDIIPEHFLVGFKEYTNWAISMWNYDGEAPKHFSLEDAYIMDTGLAGETGEVLEILKKHVRANLKKNTPIDKVHLTEELGDVFYYLAMIAHRNGIPFRNVVEYNVAKIEQRKAEKLQKIYQSSRKR